MFFIKIYKLLQKNILFLILSILFVFNTISCKNEKVNYVWEEINLPTHYETTDIHFYNENEIFVSAGKDWEYGELLHSIDKGQTWEVDSIHYTIVNTIEEDVSKSLYLSGYTGLFSRRINNVWQTINIPTYQHFDDMGTYDASSFIFVYGGAYNTSYIALTDFYGNIMQIDTFQHDFEAIDYANENDILICGFGQIMRSQDGGRTWTPVDLIGDFFKDVQFASEDVAYICGFNGSILKSNDRGKNWEWLRKGDKILVPDKRFLSLDFEDELHGLIVGKNGICWRTTNGGENWQIITNIPNYDYIGVEVFSQEAYLLSDNAKIIHLKFN